MPRRRTSAGANPFASLADGNWNTPQPQGKGGNRKGKGKPAQQKKVQDPGVVELRKFRKKLKGIVALEMSLRPLNEEQRRKLASKKEVEAKVRELEEKYPWCKIQEPKSPARQPEQYQTAQPSQSKARFTPEGRLASLIQKSPKRPPAPKNHVVILPSTSDSRKKKKGTDTQDFDPNSMTSLRKRIKSLKKELKKFSCAHLERNRKLGQVLTSEEQDLLDTKNEKQAEIKRLKKMCNKLLLEGKVTTKEKADLLAKLKKSLIACNHLEQKLARGEKLTPDEDKQLQSKTTLLKEYGVLNAAIPTDFEKAPKKKKLGELPAAVREQMFQIDKQLRVLRPQLEVALKLEERFNKKGGKPLTVAELKKMNTKERVNNQIVKLEDQQKSLLADHDVE